MPDFLKFCIYILSDFKDDNSDYCYLTLTSNNNLIYYLLCVDTRTPYIQTVCWEL